MKNGTLPFDLWPRLLAGILTGWLSLPPVCAQIAPGFTLHIDSLPLSNPGESSGQLNYRKLRILLPPGYRDNADTLPLLLMLDGQNLFENATSYAGEWNLDECLLSRVAAGKTVPLIVGLDNGGMERIEEYTPFAHPEYQGGKAEAHLEFILDRVVPFLEENYRVSKAPAWRGIGGSSLGGPMALYSSLTAPESFGFSLVFSPAFWFADSNFLYFNAVRKEEFLRSYGVVGIGEGGYEEGPVQALGGYKLNDMTLHFLEVYSMLVRKGWPLDQISWHLDPDLEHNEASWARVFPDAMAFWLDVHSVDEPVGH